MEYEILMFLYQNPHHNTATDIVNSRRYDMSKYYVSEKTQIETVGKEIELAILSHFIVKHFPILGT